MTFGAVEASGRQQFSIQDPQGPSDTSVHSPHPPEWWEFPKGVEESANSPSPSIRDRVVQGVLKLILEPIFEADFQDGSFAYRPKRSAHDAIHRIVDEIDNGKTQVIDLDLRNFYGTVRHHILLEQVARRVNDDQIMALVKKILRTGGKRGLPLGGVISPLLSNIYLNDVDRILEEMKAATCKGSRTAVAYARYADDLVVLLDADPSSRGLIRSVERRLEEEFSRLQLEVNQEKSRRMDLAKGDSFGFLGFDFRLIRDCDDRWKLVCVPQARKLQSLLDKLGQVFRRHRSQPISRVIEEINPIIRGWNHYFSGGHSTCLSGSHGVGRREDSSTLAVPGATPQ